LKFTEKNKKLSKNMQKLREAIKIAEKEKKENEVLRLEKEIKELEIKEKEAEYNKKMKKLKEDLGNAEKERNENEVLRIEDEIRKLEETK
jgi:hypothetical protein